MNETTQTVLSSIHNRLLEAGERVRQAGNVERNKADSLFGPQPEEDKVSGERGESNSALEAIDIAIHNLYARIEELELQQARMENLV